MADGIEALQGGNVLCDDRAGGATREYKDVPIYLISRFQGGV
ncbi:MAG: hypothetical protein V3R80_07375 [Candidatus Tectomicrobia bacterium]